MISKSHTKYIQSLQHKKFRDEEGLFIAEGPKLVRELLEDGNFTCREVFALDQWLNAHPGLVKLFNNALFHEIQDFELEKISALNTANQVLAVFEKKVWNDKKVFTGKITLALDNIQDPGNLGTLIRIADWFGIGSVACSVDCADQYNPKVVQSTMGSLGRVAVFYEDLPDWLMQQKDIRKYAAGMEGKPVGELQGITEGIIIIGNESRGISDAIMKIADEKITIPRKGKAESLNAAVAAGIILSHLTGT